MEQSQDGILVTDERGNIEIWNEGMEQITGIKREYATGTPAWQIQLQLLPDKLKTPELITRIEGGVNKILAAKGEWKQKPREQEIKCADGRHKYIHTSSFIIKYKDTVRLKTVIRDVSERRKAEELLHIKDWAIQSFVNGFVMADIAGTLTYVNPAFLNLVGCSSQAEVIGKQIWGFYANYETAAKIKEVLHTEGFWKGDAVALRSNGSQVLTHVVASVVLDDAGQPICLQASFADIADRKRIENQRTQEHYAFNALAELHGAQDIDQGRVLQEFVDILPQCWLYPDITCARLTLGNQNFHTYNYSKSPWKLTALVKVNKSTLGRLEVGYLEKRPDRDEGTFLKEERLLIDRLAERIGRIIEHKQGEEKLQAAYTEETKKPLNKPITTFTNVTTG